MTNKQNNKNKVKKQTSFVSTFIEAGKMIGTLFLILGSIYIIFGGLTFFLDYVQEEQIKDSQFCEGLNMSYYMIVDNGFAGSKVICLDSENNRNEYYLEEVYN